VSTLMIFSMTGPTETGLTGMTGLTRVAGPLMLVETPYSSRESPTGPKLSKTCSIVVSTLIVMSASVPLPWV